MTFSTRIQLVEFVFTLLFYVDLRTEDSVYQLQTVTFNAPISHDTSAFTAYTFVQQMYLRYGDADDHVVELKALLLQLVFNVDITASTTL